MDFKILIVILICKLYSDRDLLLVPYRSTDVSVIQWPPFLLASKVCVLNVAVKLIITELL